MLLDQEVINQVRRLSLRVVLEMFSYQFLCRMKERLESLTGTYQHVNFCLDVLNLSCLELTTVLYLMILLGMEELNCHKVVPAARQWLR